MITLPLWVVIIEYVWRILALFFIGISLPVIIRAIKSKTFINPNTDWNPNNNQNQYNPQHPSTIRKEMQTGNKNSTDNPNAKP
jgi:hypothetical protein